MRKKRTLNQIKNILENYRNSGLSKTEFCREKGMPLTTLCGWLEKESRKKLNFIPVSVKKDVPKPIFLEAEFIENLSLKCPSGFSLEIPSSISPSWLSNLLKEIA